MFKERDADRSGSTAPRLEFALRFVDQLFNKLMPIQTRFERVFVQGLDGFLGEVNVDLVPIADRERLSPLSL